MMRVESSMPRTAMFSVSGLPSMTPSVDFSTCYNSGRFCQALTLFQRHFMELKSLSLSPLILTSHRLTMVHGLDYGFPGLGIDR